MKTPKNVDTAVDTQTITPQQPPRNRALSKTTPTAAADLARARPRENDTLLQIEDVCIKLGCSDRYILDSVRSGALKANKVGKRWIILQSNLILWITTLQSNRL